MKRLNLLGAAILAVFAIAAVAASAASAAFPNSLPTGSTYKSTTGASEFGSGITAIKSASGKGSGASTTEKDGTFTTTFEKSKDQLGRACTGLSDATEGNVTVKGKTNLRWDTTLTKVLVLFLLEEVHLACGSTLIKVKGCVAGEWLGAINAAITSGTVDLVVASGDNVIIKVENAADNGTENCELKAEINDTEAKLSSQAGTATLNGFEKGLKGGNTIEIMTK